MGIETIVYCAIAVCGFAALQGVIWAYYSHRPQIEGSYAVLTLTIAVFLYSSLPASHSPGNIAGVFAGLKQGITILMMPLFLYFLSEISNSQLPAWITRSFHISAAALFVTCLTSPDALALAATDIGDPVALPEANLGYFQQHSGKFAGLYGAYFLWGFALIVWVGSRLYLKNRRFDAIILGSFVATQLLVAAWSVVVEGQTSTYVAGVVFMVIMLIVSTRLGIERKEMAKQIERQEQASSLERLQRRKLQISLQKAAETDHLTNLPNRLRLLEKLEAVADRSEFHSYSLYLFGIRHFKSVNYTFGHSAGDEVLRQAAARLERHCHGAALIARIAGDVFAVLVESIDRFEGSSGKKGDDNGYKLALRKLCQPYSVNDHYISVDYAVGVVHTNATNINNPNKCLIDAEYALQIAKSRGKDGVVIYDDSLRDAQDREFRMVAALRDAQAKGELSLAYQLKVSREQKIVGMEALLRWNSREFGAVSPGEFISLAERFGFIGALGQWVALETCQQISHWLAQGLHPGRVSFNVSSDQLVDETFSELLLAFLKKYRLDPCHIEVEITETAFMESFDQAKLQIGLLRAAGIHVSIDDFGTGHSSLARLGQLPFDSIKLDKGFVDNILSDEGVEVVRSIIGVGKAFNCSIVAEGVESKQHIDVLLELGCDTFQGYYFSKPLPAQKIDKILALADSYFAAQPPASEASLELSSSARK